MRLDKFHELYHAGAVKRYHTMRTHETQTLAAHSWGVAMICIAISDDPPSAPLLMYALTHDLAEVETGDIPAPAKWGSREISEALTALEFDFEKRHNIVCDLSDTELEILQWADTMELIMYCGVELAMGNNFVLPTFNRGKSRLKSYGFPTVRAEDFYNAYLGQRA